MLNFNTSILPKIRVILNLKIRVLPKISICRESSGLISFGREIRIKPKKELVIVSNNSFQACWRLRAVVANREIGRTLFLKYAAYQRPCFET